MYDIPAELGTGFSATTAGRWEGSDGKLEGEELTTILFSVLRDSLPLS